MGMVQATSGIPQQVVKFSRHLSESFFEDNCQSTAAALTYQTLFAVVPLLTVTYAVFEAFGASRGLGQQVEAFIFSNVVPENVSVVNEYLRSFSEQAKNLSGPSLGLLTVTAFFMLFTIERTFNDIWRIQEPRHGSQRFLMYWAVLTLGAPFLGVSLAVTTYIESLPLISDVSETTRSLHLLPVILGGSFLALVYMVVPNCDVPVKHAAVGGFAVSIVFEIAKVTFAEIMAKSNFEAIYGTFAAVPLFLLWIYISWTIVLVGAEVVKTLGVYRFRGEEHMEAPLFQLLLILELFFRAHQKGEVLNDRSIRHYAERIDMQLWPEFKAKLIELKLVRTLDRGGLVLSRDLNEVSIWDLYTMLPWQLPSRGKGGEGWQKEVSERFSDLYSSGEAALSGDLETLFREHQTIQ